MARQHLAEEHGCSFNRGQTPTHANDHQAEEHHCNMKLCSRFLHASGGTGVGKVEVVEEVEVVEAMEAVQVMVEVVEAVLVAA